MISDLQREHLEQASRVGMRSTLVGMAINAVLAAIKGVAGVLGNSYALIADAIESAADVVTSFVVLLGVRMAAKPADANHPYGHGKFEPLAAAVVIAINALILLRPALSELIDTAPAPEIAQSIRNIALKVPGVLGTHKCRVRKVGFVYFVDLDVLCDPEESIRHGHEVAHNVGEAIHSALPAVSKVLVHVEPADDFGRRSRDMVI